MHIHHLNCGTINVMGGVAIVGTGGLFKRANGVIHCLLAETNDGLVLVDTGFGTADFSQPTPLNNLFVSLSGSPREPAETALAQVQQIFSGRTWRWGELGVDVTEEMHLVADEIVAVTHVTGSGVRAAFVDQALREHPDLAPAPITKMAVLRLSDDTVASYVAEHPAAIGYLAWGALQAAPAALGERPVKTLAIEDVAPGPKQVASGDYPLSLPLFFVARSEPTGVERQFLDFCLGPQGQRIIAKSYAPQSRNPPINKAQPLRPD